MCRCVRACVWGGGVGVCLLCVDIDLKVDVLHKEIVLQR